jgi:methyl-accepting chemotaxis protein
MGGSLTALDDMRRLLAQTNASLSGTLAGIDRVSADFADMRGVLRHMDEQLAVLPEVRASLDRTSETLNATSASLLPLGQTLPRMETSMEQMNKTTQEMAGSLKKLPAQGALGIGILTAAELLH